MPGDFPFDGDDMLRTTLRLSVALALATAFHAGAAPVAPAAASPAAGTASIILPPWCPPLMPKQFCPAR
jgi:hypothetical protein